VGSLEIHSQFEGWKFVGVGVWVLVFLWCSVFGASLPWLSAAPRQGVVSVQVLLLSLKVNLAVASAGRLC
jgi:hypothetical protein